MDANDLLPNPFTYKDAMTAGYTKPALDALESRGSIKRLFRGVYARAADGDGLAMQLAGLERVVADHQVVVDRTAALLHGVDAFALGETQEVPDVEVCALRGHPITSRPNVRGKTRDLTSDDVMSIDGLLVTTPLRTSLDLGCHLKRREAFAAMCMLAHEHDLTSAMHLEELPRFKRRRGVIQLRDLAPLVDPRIESQREAWTLQAIADANLPIPVPQYKIMVDGVELFRLDFAYPLARVCVEYDGKDFHDRDEQQRRHDRDRRQWLRDNHWTVIVVKIGDFSPSAIDRWTQRVREALTPDYTTRRW